MASETDMLNCDIRVPRSVSWALPGAHASHLDAPWPAWKRPGWQNVHEGAVPSE